MKWVVRGLIVLGAIWALFMGYSLAVAPVEPPPERTIPQ